MIYIVTNSVLEYIFKTKTPHRINNSTSTFVPDVLATNQNLHECHFHYILFGFPYILSIYSNFKCN